MVLLAPGCALPVSDLVLLSLDPVAAPEGAPAAGRQRGRAAAPAHTGSGWAAGSPHKYSELPAVYLSPDRLTLGSLVFSIYDERLLPGPGPVTLKLPRIVELVVVHDFHHSRGAGLAGRVVRGGPTPPLGILVCLHQSRSLSRYPGAETCRFKMKILVVSNVKENSVVMALLPTVSVRTVGVSVDVLGAGDVPAGRAALVQPAAVLSLHRKTMLGSLDCTAKLFCQ